MTEPVDPFQPTAEPSNRTPVRMFFVTGAVVSAVSGLMYFWVPMRVTPTMQAVAVGACFLLAVLFMFGQAQARRRAFSSVVRQAGWATVLTVFVVSVSIGEGMRAANLGLLSVIVCAVCVLTHPREGARLAVACAVVMLVLTVAEYSRWLPTGHPDEQEFLPVHLAMQWVVLATAWVAGMLVSRLIGQALQAARQREQRFRELLHIAADRYWELNADLRFIQPVLEEDPGMLGVPAHYLGRRPWELNALGLDDQAMQAHRADLLAHRPFTDLVVHRMNPDGSVNHVRHSGAPKFDGSGVFQGYWGVGRDITIELQALNAARASEGRYQDLFSRSPAPLVLHRQGLVVDANEAAAQLFGHASVRTLLGSVLDVLHAPVDSSRPFRDRASQLDAQPVGASLPAADYRLRSLNGRELTVQVRMVRVDTANGPASLSIYHDITALAAAEAALRRSEATLSHLFATSPDAVTLTEMGTGRYVMVNDSFTRMFGYTADEAVGKTSLELGVWHSSADRERLVSGVRDHGTVNNLRVRVVAKSGVLVTVQCSAAKFQMDGREWLVINSRDVSGSERTRLEHEAIFQRASIGIAFTRGGSFIQVNPRFEAMFGWPADSMAGQSGSVIWLDEADYDEVGRIARPLLSAGQPAEFERQVMRRDGSRFWCRLLAQVVDRSDPSAGGTVWIAEDVTERRRAEQALATARDEAEAANRAKSAFLANTSHEIRTPLNGLMGMARLAMDAGLEENRRQAYLQQVVDSAQGLSSIISDILDLSKVEAGKLRLETLPFSLRETLRSVHRAYHVLADAKNLKLTLDMAPSVPDTVTGDPLRVRQILSNFVTNALKFTERGRVGIEASVLTDGRVRLTVHDTGLGIEDDTLAQLFVPFSQADQSITRRYGGTGLGLSICRELAHLMKGSVGVESVLGRGSTFWVDLPLPRADAVSAAPDTEAEDLEQLQGANVLLAEDNPVNMMIGVAMLEQWGVQVTQAVDGAQAVHAVTTACAQGRPFDLVLMDVQMPQMSGYEATRVLRGRAETATLPIIAFTAAALVSEREEALAAGMNDFLTKPIDAVRLRHALALHLKATARG